MRYGNAKSLVAQYMSWFECQTKHEQDTIVFEWLRYVLIVKPSKDQKKGMKNAKVFCLPIFVNKNNFVDDKVRLILSAREA